MGVIMMDKEKSKQQVKELVEKYNKGGKCHG
jgi:flagellar capping protein FliD